MRPKLVHAEEKKRTDVQTRSCRERSQTPLGSLTRRIGHGENIIIRQARKGSTHTEKLSRQRVELSYIPPVYAYII